MNDGGSAFPKVIIKQYEPNTDGMMEYIDYENGLTLRDWFAGQALMGMCANPNTIGEKGLFSQSNFNVAYTMADAMIAEREKSK